MQSYPLLNYQQYPLSGNFWRPFYCKHVFSRLLFSESRIFTLSDQWYGEGLCYQMSFIQATALCRQPRFADMRAEKIY